MNHRIHEALDGELDEASLSPAERSRLAEVEAEIAAVLAAVPVAPLPDLGAAVLGRLEARRPAAAPAPSWLWRPRRVSFAWRPAYGIAAALLLTVGFAIGRGGPGAPLAPVAAPSAQVLTRFVLDAPGARQVMLAGDFTGWQPTQVMTHTQEGTWTVVVPLDPGMHSYAFVVDGERWVPDPNAPAVDDGFGGLNSRLAVLAPDVRGL